MFSILLALAFGQRVELPKEVKGEVGQFVTVKPSALDGGAVVYVPLDSGLSIFPSDLLTDKSALVFTAPKVGRYKVLAYTAKADKPSPPTICVVVIGDAPDVPVPKPDDVKPTDIKQDPIFLQLVGIVGGLGNEKAALPKLADIYRQAGELSNCTDLGALNGAIVNIRNQSGIGQQAMTIREALGGIIEKELGTEPSAPLAGGLGDKAQKLFKRINLVLLELAK
jgi:hypothetical protein